MKHGFTITQIKCLLVSLCAREGMYAGDGLHEPDNMRVYAAHSGAGPVCRWGVTGCCKGRLSVYWRECLQGQTGIKPCCSKMMELGQDEAVV